MSPPAPSSLGKHLSPTAFSLQPIPLCVVLINTFGRFFNNRNVPPASSPTSPALILLTGNTLPGRLSPLVVEFGLVQTGVCRQASVKFKARLGRLSALLSSVGCEFLAQVQSCGMLPASAWCAASDAPSRLYVGIFGVLHRIRGGIGTEGCLLLGQQLAQPLSQTPVPLSIPRFSLQLCSSRGASPLHPSSAPSRC